MTCEEALQMLPDNALGTLSETEQAAVRHHLRGCGACRADALTLDRGVAMFASAAHAADPPAELRDRVMTALTQEWADDDRTRAGAGPRASRWQRGPVRWLAAAAVVVTLGGALAWGTIEHLNANTTSRQLAAAADDAQSYRSFLHALGGKEVRVAKLSPATQVDLGATAILYDSDHHESWVLVELNAPGYRLPLTIQLVSASGETIKLPFPVQIDADGHGAGWLVTAADITGFRTVRVLGPDGRILATGVTGIEH